MTGDIETTCAEEDCTTSIIVGKDAHEVWDGLEIDLRFYCASCCPAPQCNPEVDE